MGPKIMRCVAGVAGLACLVGLNLIIAFQGKRVEICERELITYKVQAGETK